MKSRIWFVGLGVTTFAAAWGGCSTNIAGTGAGSVDSTSSSGAGGATSSSSGTGGAASLIPFACSAPAVPPSAGDCLSVLDAGNDAGTGVQCNPVTNAGCAAGELCDLGTDTGSNVVAFLCYPGPGSAAACAACDDETPATTCRAGSSCITYDDAQDSACARYCCSSADCGKTGQCSTVGAGDTNLFGSIAPNLGFCVTK